MHYDYILYSYELRGWDQHTMYTYMTSLKSDYEFRNLCWLQIYENPQYPFMHRKNRIIFSIIVNIIIDIIKLKWSFSVVCYMWVICSWTKIISTYFVLEFENCFFPIIKQLYNLASDRGSYSDWLSYLNYYRRNMT